MGMMSVTILAKSRDDFPAIREETERRRPEPQPADPPAGELKEQPLTPFYLYWLISLRKLNTVAGRASLTEFWSFFLLPSFLPSFPPSLPPSLPPSFLPSFHCILGFGVHVQNMQGSCIGTHVAV